MGKVCTFFGHRDCPSSIKPKLRKVLIDLIENQSVDMFYVGNKGAFDRFVRSVLRELLQEYPQINFSVVFGASARQTERRLSGRFLRYHAAGGHRGSPSPLCDHLAQ